jgi:DNA-binding SARP family transcriptional activator
VLEHLARITSGDAAFVHLEAWLQLSPFDERAHAALLNALARRGRIHDGDAHLTAAVRLFEDEGLDHTPLRELWRAAIADANRSARGARAGAAPTGAPISSEDAAAGAAPPPHDDAPRVGRCDALRWPGE